MLEEQIIEEKLTHLARDYESNLDNKLFVEYYLRNTSDYVHNIPIPPHGYCIENFRRNNSEEELSFANESEEILFFNSYQQYLPNIREEISNKRIDYLLGYKFLNDILSSIPDENHQRILNLNLEEAIDESIYYIRNPVIQEYSEPSFNVSRRRIGLLSGTLVLSGMFAFGGWFGYNLHKNYLNEQIVKMRQYQREFELIKRKTRNDRIDEADALSEMLQERLEKEWFFAPTKDFLEKVEQYDDNVIDPAIRKLFVKRQYEKLKNAFGDMKKKLGNLWEDRSYYQRESSNFIKDHRALVFFLGGSFFLYTIFRRRRD